MLWKALTFGEFLPVSLAASSVFPWNGTDTRTLIVLTNGCQISITVNKNNLHLKIKGGLNMGAKLSIVKVIEQICWLISIASEIPTARLASYIKETKQGTTTREYSETIYTGKPVIKTGSGCCFNVSFTAARIEKQASQDLVRNPGHCWKTMTGLSIIASGFAIPLRPRQGSGLEAPLDVLRQLIRHGYPGRSPFALDKPIVVFPPRKVDEIDKSGQVSEGYKLRYILAADFERPLRKLGNVIYWHFDPAKVYNSVGSFKQLEEQNRVEPSAIDPYSRHFVGWTNNAWHLAGKLSV